MDLELIFQKKTSFLLDMGSYFGIFFLENGKNWLKKHIFRPGTVNIMVVWGKTMQQLINTGV